MKAGVKVFAPATVSNLACGFDIIGIALEKPGDEVIARFSDKPGLRITKVTGAKGKIPTDIRKNTAGVAVQKYLEHLGEANRGIELEVHKKMPVGSGLGSSAASAVAAVVAANELMRRPLTRRELLPFAMEGERSADGAWHADNIAPCLLGGIILIRDNPSLDVQRIPAPKGLYFAMVKPHIQILTAESRAVLRKPLTLDQLITQTGNIAGLVTGFFNSDLELISRSLNDVVVEPQRAHLIPHFSGVKEAALEAGALGCSISGAGPSIFALCANSLEAENAAAAMASVYHNEKIGCDHFISPINLNGAELQ
jgi:homoserine kinase